MKDYRDVIIAPVVTEKSMKLMEEFNKYTFKVAKGVTKTEVKEAVEHLFDVKVTNVNILNTKPKTKRRGRYVGTVGGFRKAIVSVAEGQSINIFGEEE